MIDVNRKKCRPFIITIMLISLMLSCINKANVFAAAPVIKENVNATASAGNIIIGIEGKDVTSDEKEMLDKINAARYEACNNGITPDPRNKSRMLSPSDYVEMSIGQNCTKAAKIRATEAALYMAHVRPVGSECLSILRSFIGTTYKGGGENLAWDAGEKSNIDLWLDEKNAYLGLESGQTGHYESIINPKFAYTGMATFNPTNDTAPYNWSCTAGQYSVVDVAVSGDAAKNETVIQKIEAPVSAVTNAEISGDTMINKGETSNLSLLVNLSFASAIASNTVSKCPVYDGVTWTTSKSDVLSVDANGHIEAKAEGTATISASIGTGENIITVSKEFSVLDGTVTITSVDDPAMITVETTKKPVLPSVVTANLSNGSQSEIAVVWDSYDSNKLFTYFQSKEFDITGKAGGFDVVQKIHVNAAKMTGTYTNPKVITTDSGVEPEYPKAYVGMSNGMEYEDLDVIWDEESKNYYKVKEGGTFTMKGVTSYAFPTDDGPKQFEVTLTLIVNPEKSTTTDPEEGTTTNPEEGTDPIGVPTPGESMTPISGGGEATGTGGNVTPGTSKDETPSASGNDVAADSGTQSGNSATSNTEDVLVAVGAKVENSGVEYKITAVLDSDKMGYSGNVTYLSDNSNVSNLIVPNQISINGKKYRVTYIAKNAFKGNKKLKKITIGKSVIKIGANAFCGCKNLKKITFKGTSVKNIGKNAFKGVSKNAKVYMPKKVKTRYKTLLKKSNYKGKLG